MSDLKDNTSIIQLEDIHNAIGSPDESMDSLIRQGEEIDEAELKLSFLAMCKKHKLILLYAGAAYLCGMTYGYDSIANGATLSMPSFLIYFGNVTPTGELYLPSIWTSLWTSMSGLGQAIGAFVAGPIAHRFGRRWTVIAFSSTTILGVALQFISKSRELLLVGKMINGGAVGALLAVGTTYASEIAPTCLRGVLLSGLVFFSVVMQGVGLGVVRAFVPNIAPIAFRTAFAIQWAVGIFPIIAFFFSPESPTWLLSKGRYEEARHSIVRLYGNDGSVNARLAHIANVLKKESHTEKPSIVECFKGVDLKRTVTVIWIFAAIGLLGAAFLTQNIYFLIVAGLEPIHCFDIGIGGFGLACIFIALTWVFSNRVGRRTLWLVGSVGNCIGLAIVGGLAYSKSRGALWGIAVILNLLISWQIGTCVSTGWTLAPELSSMRLRQHTQSIGYATQALITWLFSFVSPYMYNVDSGNLGAKTGFVYAGGSVIVFIISYFLIPETAGLSIEEIDVLYAEGAPPRHFSKRRSMAHQSPDVEPK